MPSPGVLGGRKPKSMLAGSDTKGGASAIARAGGAGRLAGTALSLGLAVGADAGFDGAGAGACANASFAITSIKTAENDVNKCLALALKTFR